MSVQEYLEKHRLSRKIEDAVNAAVRAKTPDPVLHIANHMKKAVPAVITKIVARQILDSRGNPTVEVDLHTNKGEFRASVPNGDSHGMYEAIELHDGDDSRYMGRGVSKAVKNVNDIISRALIGMDPTLQSDIDHRMVELDKTESKGELGANAMLAVSIAACRAGAAEKDVPLYKYIADLSGTTRLSLPVPVFTLINGGKHAGNHLLTQEIMILPVMADSFGEALQMGAETYHHLRAVISEKYGPEGSNVGDGGGFAPNISSFREAMDLVKEAIERAGYNGRIKVAIDAAATEFCMGERTSLDEFEGKKYDLDFKTPDKSGKNFKTGEEMIELYTQLCTEYPVVSIVDPFDKDDWENTKTFSALGVCQVVGGELLMSNTGRMHKAIQDSTCNSLVLNVTQVGTVTDAIEAVKVAKDAAWGVVVSHRCGETEDSFIADLAVGLAAGQINAGAPCRSERLAKYNQLLRIEEELGENASYASENWK